MRDEIETMQDAATQLMQVLTLVDELRKDAAAEGIPLTLTVGGGLIRLELELPVIPGVQPHPARQEPGVTVRGPQGVPWMMMPVSEPSWADLRKAEAEAEAAERDADDLPRMTLEQAQACHDRMVVEAIAQANAELAGTGIRIEPEIDVAIRLGGGNFPPKPEAEPAERPRLTLDVALPADVEASGGHPDTRFQEASGAGAGSPVPAPERSGQTDPEPAPLKAGPWSGDELRELERLLGAGKTVMEIAAALNRSPQGVGAQVGRLKGRATRPADVPPAPETEPEPTPAPEVPAFLVSQSVQPKPVRAADRRAAVPESTAWNRHIVRTRLDGLGNVAPWTPEADLALVEGLMRGDGMSGTSEKLGIARAECVARWNDLCPEKGIDQQKWLVEDCSPHPRG